MNQNYQEYDNREYLVCLKKVEQGGDAGKSMVTEPAVAEPVEASK